MLPPHSGLPRPKWPELAFGSDARVKAATSPAVDMVVSAIVGVAGLEATYEAVRLGKRVGLANKEVLVSGGSLVMSAPGGAPAKVTGPLAVPTTGVTAC